MNLNIDLSVNALVWLNLLKFIEMVTIYVDQGYPVDVIFLDFQKSFDKVPHGRLLQKVKALCIRSQMAN